MDKLIAAVSEHPELYNSTLESYKNPQRKSKAWAAVSLQLKLPVSECRTKWKSMRDTFAKQRKVELQKQSTGEPFQANWKYYQHMNFIGPFLKDRSSSPFVQGSHGGKTKGHPGDHSEDDVGEERSRKECLQGKVEENGKEAKQEEQGQQDEGDRSAGCQSVDAGEATTMTYEVDPDLADPDYSPSPSLSLPAQPLSYMLRPGRRPRRKKKRPVDCDNNSSDSEISNTIEDDAADEMFFFSLLPYLKRLSYEKKSALKLQIHQLIYEAAFE